MNDTEIDFQRECGDYVGRHVKGCVSDLVAALSNQYGNLLKEQGDLHDFVEEAFALCEPTVTDADREEVLREKGYRVVEREDGSWGVTDRSAHDACVNALENSDYFIHGTGKDENPVGVAHEDKDLEETFILAADIVAVAVET